MEKINIAVLMGGNSTEHDISLLSGREVVKHLNPNKYNIFPVVISRNGINWDSISLNNFLTNSASKSKKATQFSEIENKIDIVFIALHGAYGEDGRIQAYLELKNIPYTGSGVLSSALCIDKEKTKIILQNAKIKVPTGISVKKHETLSNFKNISFPVFVKPNSHGSSVAASIAKNEAELVKKIKQVHKIDKVALAEEYIQGTEITASVLGTKNPVALPLIEIVSKNTFFDFESKYNPNLSEEICPARINKKFTTDAQKIAVKAYKALECRSFARIDMLIKKSEIFVLEVNTIPGLTSVSLFPKAAKVAGIDYHKLLDFLIKESLTHSLIHK